MPASCRLWWRNCALQTDAEIMDIDGMEDDLSPIDANTSKTREAIHFPRSDQDRATRYIWMILNGGDYEAAYRSDCPDEFKEHRDFWLATVRTLIHDTADGDPAEVSLALAIDMLMPCHWRREVACRLAGQDDQASTQTAVRRASDVCSGRARVEQAAQPRLKLAEITAAMREWRSSPLLLL